MRKKRKVINNINYLDKEKKFFKNRLDEIQMELDFLLWYWRENFDNVDEKFFDELNKLIDEIKWIEERV